MAQIKKPSKVNFKFKGDSHEFRTLLCKVIGCDTHHNKSVRTWIMTFEADEPMPKAQHMKLAKPIKPGFRRPFTITPDEPVDVNASGTYVAYEILSGDSTVTIDAASTATEIKGFINGDGATGAKSVRFSADGHVGEGDQVVTLDVEFDVANPDATVLGFAEGADEPIPT